MNTRINELNNYANKLEITIYEAAFDLLMDFYEAAGFQSDVLVSELHSKNEEQLIEMYLAL